MHFCKTKELRMHFDFWRIVFDSGLLVLIWMVQLLIYPSFEHYPKLQLVTWHTRYTPRIGYIVMPLMLGQLGMYLYQVIRNFDYGVLINLVLVILIWTSTFVQFVPIHSQMATYDDPIPYTKQLVRLNWTRTVLWSIIFSIDVLQLYFGL